MNIDKNNSDLPLVSVSLTTYNHAPYIAATLESMLSQKTTFPFEICIGEDDSSDETREICKQYAEQHPDIIRLFLRDRKDMIPYNGRPSGRYNYKETLQACRGKYIATCDGDDYWCSPHKLQTQADFLEGHPDFSICFIGSKKLKRGRFRRANRHVPGKVTGLADIVKRVYMPTASVMFRNGCFDDLNEWFEKVPYMDHLLFCMAARYGKIRFIKQVMSVYRMHDTGVWSSQSQQNRLINRIALRQVVAEMLKKDFSRESAIALDCCAEDSLKLAGIFRAEGEFDESAQCIRHALELSPKAALEKLL